MTLLKKLASKFDYTKKTRNFPLWVLDEIHKYRDWRNFLKGLYDQYHDAHKILVTGSAQLDCYRRGGDSLQGRYHYLRLYPLSVAELGLTDARDIQHLFTLGGFLEPYFKGSEQEAKRWSSEYRHRLIEEDLGKLEQVRELSKLEQLMLRLPALVGSPLSINALREDLQVSHAAVSNWLDIFTRLYAIFRIAPFGAPTLRAVKKEQKHYHFDWTLVENLGTRFENMVAMGASSIDHPIFSELLGYYDKATKAAAASGATHHGMVPTLTSPSALGCPPPEAARNDGKVKSDATVTATM